MIRRVDRESLASTPQNRLASISGTSLISHGIDLERLNVLFVLGMPSTLAYYVQATSRAGRTGVGIVFTGLSRYFVRDRSVFHFFEPSTATSTSWSSRSPSTGSARTAREDRQRPDRRTPDPRDRTRHPGS